MYQIYPGKVCRQRAGQGWSCSSTVRIPVLNTGWNIFNVCHRSVNTFSNSREAGNDSDNLSRARSYSKATSNIHDWKSTVNGKHSVDQYFVPCINVLCKGEE